MTQVSGTDRIPFLDLTIPHAAIANELHEAQRRVVVSGRFLLGAECELFESAFAAYVGARYCIAVGSGLDALKLALLAAGIRSGDEVIVPSHTFIATWLAVSQIGALPVPVEPDPDTCNIEPAGIEAAVSSRTAAIVPVHLYGQPCAMGAIAASADRHGLRIVEDAAQAHGARYGDSMIGGLGNTAAWSFYPAKNLGALGDGGAVTTDDRDVADRVRFLRNYGSKAKYVHVDPRGINSRLDELQCAFLNVKLRYLDAWNEQRKGQARRYTEGLRGSSARPVEQVPGSTSSWHLFVVRSRRRDALREHLRREGVETIVHYPVAPHRQEAYEGVSLRWRSLPVCERLQTEVLSLPIGPHLSDRQVERVVELIKGFDG